MRDLSLHLLDLVQNAIKAEAKMIRICIEVDERGILSMTIEDNGKGMSPELLSTVLSPFSTTRTTRKVGLGLPMMQENARRSGGDLTIESTLGKGTSLVVTLDTNNIDCIPLGDLQGTMLSLLIANPLTPDFLFEVRTPKGHGLLDVREVHAQLGDIPLSEANVVAWLTEAIEEEFNPILGGIV